MSEPMPGITSIPSLRNSSIMASHSRRTGVTIGFTDTGFLRPGGITVTDGRGSSRIHEYAGYTDDQMQSVRQHEQRKAAFVGEYAAVAQLDFPSSAVKAPGPGPVVQDLVHVEFVEAGFDGKLDHVRVPSPGRR